MSLGKGLEIWQKLDHKLFRDKYYIFFIVLSPGGNTMSSIEQVLSRYGLNEGTGISETCSEGPNSVELSLTVPNSLGISVVVFR